MFHLPLDDIHLAKSAPDKENAIRQVAAALTKQGYVSDGYVEGMLNREKQTATYLGNGIAIPHGTTDTRDEVLKTGVQVFQFPDGVMWADGQLAYVVIGIAAKSDEHLALLRQLTKVLSDESAAKILAQTDSAEELRRVLMGEHQAAEFKFDASQVSLDIASESLMTLQALNAGRLQQIGAVNANFVSQVITQSPMNLGQGIWLSDSPVGNLSSAAALARPATPFEVDGEKVGLLLTVAMADTQPEGMLTHLCHLLQSNKASRLLNTENVADIVALLTSDVAEAESALNAEFVLRNEHGLHARPSALLVNTVKQFTSQITITNLDGSGIPVNGRSMMKVVALGVKKGHRLRFTACGSDAQQALDAIGKAINEGLGEGIA